MNSKEYLPIGSVVLLKGGKKRVMVIGFAPKTKEQKNEIYDYVGCLFPEGIISASKTLFFNHEKIDKIFFTGYTDVEDVNFKRELNEMMSNK